MALTGTLEAFPLPEVLRLLARSGKTGALRVDSNGMQGKIYMVDGALAYATTRRDEDLRTDLLNAGMVSSSDWTLVERREREIAEVLAEGVAFSDYERLITEQATDVLFRLRRPGHGTFDFNEGVLARYTTGHHIDVEICIADAERRIAQWAEIEAVIPGVNHRLRMVPRLSRPGQVVLEPETWQLLAALEGKASVAEIADRIGSTDFTVAQRMADLVRLGLVEVVDGGVTSSASRPAAARLQPVESENVGLTPAARTEPADVVPEPVAPAPVAAESTALDDIEMLGESEVEMVDPVVDPIVEDEELGADDDESSVLESLLSDVIGGGGAGRANLTVVEEDEGAPSDPQRRVGGRGLLSRELSDLNE